jgi:hypothetical protein
VLRIPFYIALALIVSFGGGIIATLAALKYTSSFGAVEIGQWRAFPMAQTVEADPYTKSHRANAGRLLFGTAEGLTFTAQRDAEGEALRSECDYHIRGNMPATRFWTIFAGDAAGRLAQAQDERPVALNSRILLRDPKGGIDISASRSAKPFNWLALPKSGNFSLVISLLDTPVASSTGLIDVEMPIVTKIGCDNA